MTTKYEITLSQRDPESADEWTETYDTREALDSRVADLQAKIKKYAHDRSYELVIHGIKAVEV